MYARVLWLMCFMCEAITVERKHRDIVAQSKIELDPILISCQLNDVAVISAPPVHSKDPIYYLYKPNGDSIQLEFNNINSTKKYTKKNYDDLYFNSIFNKYFIKKIVQTENPVRNNRILDFRSYFGKYKSKNIEEEELKSKDFFMGPFLMEDHGNWLLSTYCQDIDDNWIEMFQTITVEIVDHVPLKTTRIKDGVEISFVYPISHLESCEIIAPRSTYDRYYDRSKLELDKCGYIISNINEEDEGLWTIIGVGKIVYKGTIRLKL